MMRIGILGGGQLSRMIALAGIPLGLDFLFFEPKVPCCAEKVGKVITGNYQEKAALLQFAELVDVITYENENIPLETLQFLQHHCPIYPGLDALKFSQDRLLEKNLFCDLNIPTTPFKEVNTQSDLQQAIVQFGYPIILKKRREGYDGKGQIKINSQAEFENLKAPDIFKNAIAEKFIKFDREVSLIGACSISKSLKFYDINENVHQSGILISTKNKPNDPSFNLAKKYVEALVDKLSYVGTITLEFFQIGNELVANEMAPRVHNSGHWTIEGATTCQFENHLRAILDWPLGDTKSIGLSTMRNIIGAMPDKVEVLKDSIMHLHDYQKEPREGRKIGHITSVTV